MAQPILNHIPWVSALFACGAYLSPLQAPLQAQPLSVEAVADRLTGLLVHDLEGDRQIHMTTCAVTHTEDSTPNSLYLYQEQARDDKLDQPYRQRFLQLKVISLGKVASISYRPTHEEKWVGLCQTEKSDRLVTAPELLPTHCTVTLQKQGQQFVGTTPKEGCSSNYRGAAFVKNRVILTPEGMETFDQGFDANGNRVWGSDGTPYTFKKVSP